MNKLSYFNFMIVKNRCKNIFNFDHFIVNYISLLQNFLNILNKLNLNILWLKKTLQNHNEFIF